MTEERIIYFPVFSMFNYLFYCGGTFVTTRGNVKENENNNCTGHTTLILAVMDTGSSVSKVCIITLNKQ
jgi:hypothetical protein